MRILDRFAVSIGAAALFAGCDGTLGDSTPVQAVASDRVHTRQKTFTYTGEEKRFVVPSGVTSIDVVARGAAGAFSDARGKVGRGGRVYATVPVSPGETLYVFVGGQGATPTGGFNGGADGGSDPSCGRCAYGGGGASDVRQGGDILSDRIVIAGGGGGQGFDILRGGYGGGAIGGNGRGGPPGGQRGRGGSGGTQSQGGAGGAGGDYYGNAGSSGALGVGGSGGLGNEDINPGGGGGGGYYGGGGGGSGSEGMDGRGGGTGGGGGGGSSYVEAYAIKFQTWIGWKDATGNGVVVIRW